MERKVVIFCASSTRIDPKYNAAAREVVRALHALGYTVVSGGGAIGTMGAITDESIRCGGRHIAVLPRFMKGLENPGVSEIVWTDTMSVRKEKMREGTQAVIALPGGIGTQDELVETHTLRKLGQYHGELFALNLDGFYDPYKALLDHYVETGMMSAQDRDLLHFPETPEELISYFKQ
ncbi:MAG: TIGR00730 family Rossman fold protein [Bacteroidales bacterium]|nr:TIGR00730 family Rossman fold protein [Bacteroidales bacterium]